MRALSAQGTAVPRVLAFDGTWLIQEDIGGRRLAEAIADAPPAAAEAALDAALASLAAIHRAGRTAALERRVAVLGARTDWLMRLFERANVVGRQLGLPAPPLQREALAALLRVRDPWLIKWDARLGNVLVAPDARLVWIDWEHCGSRNRLDDVAWLLCDEYVPDLPEAEQRLLDRHLRGFADGWAPDEAARYLAAYGTFHSLVRLSVVLDRKGAGPWWDRPRCLAADMPDISCEGALVLCRRAARWAARTPLTEALAPWLSEAGAAIVALPADGRVVTA